MTVQNILELGGLLDPMRGRIPNLEEQRSWAIAEPKKFVELVKRQMELIQINAAVISGQRNKSWKANLCQTVTEEKACRIAKCTFAHQLSLVYAIRFSTNPKYKERGCLTERERGAEPCPYYDEKNKTWLKCRGAHEGDLQIDLEEETVRVFRNPEEADGKEADAISQGSWNNDSPPRPQPRISSIDGLSQEIDPVLAENGVPYSFETQMDHAIRFPRVFVQEVKKLKEIMKGFGFIQRGWKAAFCRSLLSQRVCKQKECRFAHALEILIAANSRGDFGYKQKTCVKQNCAQSGKELASFGKCRALHPGDLLINWERETVEIFNPRHQANAPQPPVFLGPPVWVRQFDAYGREFIVPAFMPMHPQSYSMPIPVRHPYQALPAPHFVPVSQGAVPSLLARVEAGPDPFDEGESVAQSVAQSVLETPPRHIAQQVAAHVLEDGDEGEGGGGDTAREV